ncbi:MAG: HNH endonuclease [Liquorilactobacillus nagelii]|uniref:HNH endonuclease n=1 Tax=Liquorilactobacillus nagelii TaxID=82688 RepID=UPI0039ED8DC2
MVPRSISKPFYRSKAWQRCRAGYIKSVGGLCERCLAKGIIKHGYIVHHKRYITEDNIGDPLVTLNWDNLEYLCHDCHNAEHFSKDEVTRDDVMFDESGQLVSR